jgi:hypothetical protein
LVGNQDDGCNDVIAPRPSNCLSSNDCFGLEGFAEPDLDPSVIGSVAGLMKFAIVPPVGLIHGPSMWSLVWSLKIAFA